MGRRFTQEQVLDAIKNSGAIITVIAARLDCAWSTAESYVKKWDKTRQAFRDETEQIKDVAESTLINSIKQGNTTDVKWYLSKKAKDRGYGETAPQPADENEDTEIKIEIVDGENDD